jgi:hypothetical protein
MLFKRTEDLKVGMRLARPVYNKSGVLYTSAILCCPPRA